MTDSTLSLLRSTRLARRACDLVLAETTDEADEAIRETIDAGRDAALASAEFAGVELVHP